MRIAIDARMYGKEECSGIGDYIHNLTDALFKLDTENEYVLFMREPQFSRFNQPNERVKKVMVTPRWYSYAEQLVLPFQLAKEKFDLIHYPHFNSPVFYFKKSVCTIHDLTPFYFPGHKMGSLIRRIGYRLVFNATVAKARRVLTVSDSTKRGVVDLFGVPENKIKTTLLGVDEIFRKDIKSDIINSVKTKYSITKPYLFFLGVWRNHKNVEGLVRAFGVLKRKYNLPHQLVLGGREDLHYTKVKEEIEASEFKKDIIATGFIADDDLPALYAGAEAFVLPSFIEGFGLIAIEAQSCGCPVASTNTSSMPEVLGDSAIYFDPSDADQMAEQMHRILSEVDLRQKLILLGAANASRFSWEKCAAETLETYRQAIKS
jgi:glycosyltransferase involved in cell wall biosynthesis